MIGIRGVAVMCVLVASAAHAGLPADPMQAVDDAVDSGDAWDVGVTKVTGVLGQPSIASETSIEWAVMTKDACMHVVLEATDNGFFVGHFASTLYQPKIDELYPRCKKLAAQKKVKLPKLHTPAPLDADAQATTVVTELGTGKIEDLYQAASPAFRKSSGSPQQIARLMKLFEMRAGKFVKVGAPDDHAFKDSAWVVYIPVSYEKGTLRAAVSFVPYQGKPSLIDFRLTLPKELQAHPDPLDAARVARADLDLLLAAKIDAFFEHLDREVIDNVSRATFDPQLTALLKQIGKVQSIKQTEQKECGNSQCFTFEIKAAGGTSTATFKLSFFIAEWVVSDFNLSPPQ